MFISDAMAQAGAVSQEGSLTSLVPLLLIMCVFYFVMIRPQSKKYKEHQEMVNHIKSNQKIVTTGGIVGVVRNVDQKEGIFDVEIADGVVIKLLKSSVAEIKADDDKKSDAKKKNKSKGNNKKKA